MLSNQGSWIFLPRSVSLFIDGSAQSETLEIKQKKEEGAFINVVTFKLNSTFRKIKLEFETLPEIPQWHAGAGKAPWFFIDEVWTQ